MVLSFRCEPEVPLREDATVIGVRWVYWRAVAVAAMGKRDRADRGERRHGRGVSFLFLSALPSPLCVRAARGLLAASEPARTPCPMDRWAGEVRDLGAALPTALVGGG